MIKGIQNVYVAATDLGKSVQFYRDVLGLPLKFQDGDRWAQFDIGGTSFSISSANDGRAVPGQGAVTIFEVNDLEAAFTTLRERGASIEGELVDMGDHGRYFTVLDPSGSPVQLFQRANGA